MLPGILSAVTGGSGSDPVLTYIGTTSDGSDSTTYTFTDHATGTADGNRKTIVGITGRDSTTNFSISGVTVGGVAATMVVDTTAITGVIVQSAIYIIDNPSGTTATIAVTFSEAIVSCSVSVWSAVGLRSSTPTDTAVDSSTSGATLTLDLTLDPLGLAVGVNCSAGNGTHTWTGLTERADQNMGDGGNHTAADVTATVGGALAITADPTSGGDIVGVSACFR